MRPPDFLRASSLRSLSKPIITNWSRSEGAIFFAGTGRVATQSWWEWWQMQEEGFARGNERIGLLLYGMERIYDVGWVKRERSEEKRRGVRWELW